MLVHPDEATIITQTAFILHDLIIDNFTTSIQRRYQFPRFLSTFILLNS